MITFQQFMETIAQLGSYTGDYTQARMALDKHEEGDATFGQIEAWVKAGLVEVLKKIKAMFATHSFGFDIEINYIINALNSPNFNSKTAPLNQDPEKYNSTILANIHHRIKTLVRALYNIKQGRSSTIQLSSEEKGLVDEFFKIVNTHVRSAGTKELVSKMVSDDSVPILISHLSTLLYSWSNRRDNLFMNDETPNLDDLNNIPEPERRVAVIEILGDIVTSLRAYYSSSKSSHVEDSKAWTNYLKAFAKNKMAREATPNRILSAVDKLVAKL